MQDEYHVSYSDMRETYLLVNCEDLKYYHSRVDRHVDLHGGVFKFYPRHIQRLWVTYFILTGNFQFFSKRNHTCDKTF